VIKVSGEHAARLLDAGEGKPSVSSISQTPHEI
jgi:hypothetical protein